MMGISSVLRSHCCALSAPATQDMHTFAPGSRLRAQVRDAAPRPLPFSSAPKLAAMLAPRGVRGLGEGGDDGDVDRFGLPLIPNLHV